ncbi:radical SAM/SPASM domain-containing protein [Desulfosediminicola flagellatus]|uniref:radical SAM/SPASM domain-containing protein n=1 Tax=Desulfosediminicola flagellatus TaxID=2569541 RepID=UPI0010AB6B97|nr:radical SAM protein [Desulfosediminicola flagellatus]
MIEQVSKAIEIQDIAFWNDVIQANPLLSFSLELTARCNNNCRHCYVNLPTNDISSINSELSLVEIKRIVDQVVQRGALWVLLTGGEPLLRDDFQEIYLYLKRKGLLVSVFTNGTLLNEEYVKLFRDYPPRDLELTVYGVSPEIYGNVTGKKNHFDLFINGLDLLDKYNVSYRLKAIAMKSTLDEFDKIKSFCQGRTKDYFYFDYKLHLRTDRNQLRNQLIIEERLSTKEILKLEADDPARSKALAKNCDNLIGNKTYKKEDGQSLFRCAIGNGSMYISSDGSLRLCQSLTHDKFVYDLKQGTLESALKTLVPKITESRSDSPEYSQRCGTCNYLNLCMWCPAHAYLECGRLDEMVDYFCELAHEHAGQLLENTRDRNSLIE